MRGAEKENRTLQWKVVYVVRVLWEPLGVIWEAFRTPSKVTLEVRLDI